MAIKSGWDFPSLPNASTRGYTRARPMRQGGKVSDAAQDKAAIKAAVHAHERHDHPGEPLTKLKEGGPLTAARRDALKGSSFALPGRRYPINDANHARNALSRVSQNGTPAEKAEVRAAVKRKYPAIGKK